jgi:hypothetical protein
MAMATFSMTDIGVRTREGWSDRREWKLNEIEHIKTISKFTGSVERFATPQTGH